MGTTGKRQLIVITGRSGAGRTVALKALEDMGFEAVDNLPLSLLTAILRTGSISKAQSEFDFEPETDAPAPLAVGVDIRTRDFDVKLIFEMLALLKSEDTDVTPRLVFLDCDEDVLVRRFTETRRKHPLAMDRPLKDGIARESEIVLPLKSEADIVIDTTDFRPWDLKNLIKRRFSEPACPVEPHVHIVSFSFKKGIPREADLVFDVRFLENPHYEKALRPLTGLDGRVGEFIEKNGDFAGFFDKLTDFLDPLLPKYAQEGKSYLTIAVGCTGGRHRSVYTASRLADRLGRNNRRVSLRHRELGSGTTQNARNDRS